MCLQSLKVGIFAQKAAINSCRSASAHTQEMKKKNFFSNEIAMGH